MAGVITIAKEHTMSLLKYDVHFITLSSKAHNLPFGKVSPLSETRVSLKKARLSRPTGRHSPTVEKIGMKATMSIKFNIAGIIKRLVNENGRNSENATESGVCMNWSFHRDRLFVNFMSHAIPSVRICKILCRRKQFASRG